MQTRSLSAALPAPVYSLFQWAEGEDWKGRQRVPAGDVSVKEARDQALDWLQKTIDRSWLPKSCEPIFIRSEFDGRDVVRARWVSNGFVLEASQTASILAIRLTPEPQREMGAGRTQRLEKARETASQLFVKQARCRNDQGEVIAVDALSDVIMAESFRDERALALEDGTVVGRPFRPGPPGMRAATAEVNSIGQGPAETSGETNAVRTWAYWFHDVHWWNDGKSVGFYFFKLEGGPWIPDFSNTRDAIWFRGQARTNSSTK